MTTNLSIKSSENGELMLFNDRTRVTFHVDGTIAISSLDPVQLTGECAATLINTFGQANVPVFEFLKALNKKR